MFGLLGANGAGKSTTFRMLCGLLPATEGSLRVAGLDLRHAAAAARARIGYMSQKFSLYGNLSVCENLRFFSSAYGLSGQRQQRAAWSGRWSNSNSAPMADTDSLDLPLGHKQRLAMACALMHEPEILFLDEPTSGVDPLARREFWSRINALAEQRVTVMVTTHFMEEAEYCDRLAIMADGEILALGTPEEIKQRQRTAEHPEPTMEDAFIALIEGKGQTASASLMSHRAIRKVRHPRAARGGGRMRLRGLIRKEFYQILRDPSSIAIAFLLPVVLLLIFGYGVSLDAEHVPIALVVEQPSADTASFTGGFQQSRYFAAGLHARPARGGGRR